MILEKGRFGAEIQAGGKWSITKEFANPAGQFRRQQTLTWVGRESHENVPQERIDLSANLTLLAPPADAPQGPVDSIVSKIKTQKTSGTIWFDSDRGMITQGTVDSSLTTESPYREKSIVVQIKSQVKLNVRRVE